MDVADGDENLARDCFTDPRWALEVFSPHSDSDSDFGKIVVARVDLRVPTVRNFSPPP